MNVTHETPATDVSPISMMGPLPQYFITETRGEFALIQYPSAFHENAIVCAGCFWRGDEVFVGGSFFLN